MSMRSEFSLSSGRAPRRRRQGLLLFASLGLALVVTTGVPIVGSAPGELAAQETPKSEPKVEVKAEPKVEAARAPANMTATEVAERIQGFYQKTTDFQSSFKQTYTDVAAGESKTSSGTVYFKKPGKMRWDYNSAKDAKKRDKVLVSDGSTFWIYEFEFQQVFKQCLAESQLPTSLRFLMGEGNLLDEFDVELTPKSTAARPELKLTPKQPTAQYRELRFIVDPTTFQVARTTIYDPYGNTNQIEFNSMRVNRNLPDSGFEFSPPKGARVLNPQKSC
ncbi:MAG: outer membrane lipoprotein carrier protein LolA [Bradymonadaceae bacterium]|nr:outer membrane lipoprotein carrier protein LolA [Lujinxingiaceae bacterium]